MPDRPPQGPPWGHQGGPPGWGPGRHIFGRLIGFILVTLLVFTVLGALFAPRFGRFGAPHRLFIAAGLLVLVVIGLAVVARVVFGRSWAPVGELIDATRRLGDGESGVRIEQTGPGPFGAVGASFNRMAARLEEEDERRRRLLADLGHELRTPLTVIRGEIEAVLDGVHQPESLGNVIDEVELMERLLEDLRVLTLTEAGRLRLHPEPTELEAVIDDVIASFAAPMESRGVHAEVRVGDTVGEVTLDPYRVRQVLGNLVSNALNQMPDGGTVTVSADRIPSWVAVTVADTGPGIAPDRLEQVFQRFVKSGDSTGTGLGLSIAKDLVEAHGGRITAANRPQGGAIFTFWLPA